MIPFENECILGRSHKIPLLGRYLGVLDAG